jgi:hypothetical protein
MITNRFNIQHIPAILWGADSSRMIIAVHGKQSSKTDDCIQILAEEAVVKGYQVLSFDFPEHGERTEKSESYDVWQCVKELKIILEFAKNKTDHISLFACSLGAYFSLLAFQEEYIRNTLFLSPVVNMERIIENMMNQFQVTEQQLKDEKKIETPYETLDWDYYSHVKANPIKSWNQPTSILYGENDNLCEYDVILAFTNQNHCDLEVEKGGEHWFHTAEQLDFFRDWVKQKL